MDNITASSIYSPDVSDKEQKWFEAFRRYIVPALGVGEAIASRGQSPGTAAMNVEKNFQSQEDRKRAMLKEEQANNDAALERAVKARKEARTKAAQESLPGALDLMQDTNTYKFSPINKPSFDPTVGLPKAQGAPVEPGVSDPNISAISKLLDKYSIDNVGGVPTEEPKEGLKASDALVKSGAAQYLDEPSVENFIRYMDDSKRYGLGGGATGARIRAATEADRIAARATIDALIKSGEITDDLIPSYKATAESDPLLINQMFSNKDIAKNAAVNQYEEITPLATDRETATTNARLNATAYGTKTIEPNDQNFLTNTRSVYSDITKAKAAFDDKFATQYIGKGLKLYWMKQNDPKFATFIAALEKGLSKYRKENFGTAQTGSELENLKTLLNSDLDVSPEVFKKQLDNFLSSTNRDYNDKVGFLQGNKVVIPKGYESIIIDIPKSYNSEMDAREDGKKSGDIIYLKGVGKIRLD